MYIPGMSRLNSVHRVASTISFSIIFKLTFYHDKADILHSNLALEFQSPHRYINDCINPAGYNVEFVKLPHLGCALVRALRDIAPYEELFVSYGSKYWMMQKPVRPTFTEIRAIREKGLKR